MWQVVVFAVGFKSYYGVVVCGLLENCFKRPGSCACWLDKQEEMHFACVFCVCLLVICAQKPTTCFLFLVNTNRWRWCLESQWLSIIFGKNEGCESSRQFYGLWSMEAGKKLHFFPIMSGKRLLVNRVLACCIEECHSALLWDFVYT